MNFPGFDRVFRISDPLNTRPFRGSLRDDTSGLSRVAIATGKLVPSKPLRIVPYGGRVPGDFIWTDAGCIRLVHERILDVFANRRITGWSTFPVEVFDKEGLPIQGFRGLSVIGSCGRIDPNLSTPIQKQMPAGLRPYFKGYYFPTESWDGSHVFRPKGTTAFFVIDVVLDLLRELQAKNFVSKALSEMDFGPSQKKLFESKLTMDEEF